MILKSILLLSIALNTCGLGSLAQKFDSAYINNVYGSNNQASAETIDLKLPDILPRPYVKENSIDPLIYAKRYILADLDSNIVLNKKNEHERVPIASTTKIMTASIVLENYKLDEVVTVSKDAANQIGADAYLRTGEQITVYNLLKCLLIKSANGAAYALAEHMNKPGEIGTAKFVKKMNEKAKEVGMKDTDYHDPAGLDVTGYSSAYDLFLITKYALQKTTFAEIVKIKTDSVTDITKQIWHQLENSNRLVREWEYPGAIGIKTGYMPEAGHCLVGAAKRDGHTLVAIVLYTNADTPKASAEESRKLLDWGWQNVEWFK